MFREHKYSFFKSFFFAMRGIFKCFVYERNFRFHIMVAAGIILFSALLKINIIEWIFVTSAIFIVLICEMINTAIEKLCDLIEKGHCVEIEVIKDISSGFVLLASIYSIIVGVIVFLPYLIKFLKF